MSRNDPLIVQMYIRLMPGSVLLGQSRDSDDLYALRRDAAGQCWGDELMYSSGRDPRLVNRGNWTVNASMETGGFSEYENERFEFRGAGGMIADENKYKALCDDMRAFWKISLLDQYPGLPQRKLDETLRGARFHYSRKYGAVVGSFIHTGLDEYKTPRKPGMMERLFARKDERYDKTLCMYIAPLMDLHTGSPLRLKDSELQREMAESLMIGILKAHYLQQVRPPVRWNYRYTIKPIPLINEEVERLYRFWGDDTRDIVHRDRFRLLCDTLREPMKEELIKEFPAYDREKLEDGMEGIAFDYDPVQGAITASILLDKLMLIEYNQ